MTVAVVTGGAGFIGSHLCDHLVDAGITDLRIIDNFTGGRRENIEHLESNPNVQIFEIDIRDIAAQTSIFAGVDYVFHLAGIGDIVPSIERPFDYMSVNVQGTVNILECCRNNDVKKMVYAASSSCYGLADVPTDEKHRIDTQYPYALSKHLGEMATFHWQDVYGVPANSICIFNAYGPRVKTTGAYGAVFGVFLKQKLAGQPFTIVGDGTQTRDFVYVTDVAKAFLLAARSGISGQRFNVGAGKPQSINYLVELLGGEKIHLPKRPGEPDCTYADITKVTNLLGWAPSVSFEEGVKHMLDGIAAWENAPLWTPNKIRDATKTWFDFLDRK